MSGLNTFLRIARIFGKALLGLLIVLLLTVALLHLPPVQKQITHSLSNYLSSRLHAKVEIERIHFSITGHVIIDQITVWDPGEDKVFSAQKIQVSASILDLLAGDLIFDEVSIAGAEGHLAQGEHGLNIQYIIDAFKPATIDTTTTTKAVTLLFKKVLLENIVFEFTSAVNGITVSVNLGKFLCEGGSFSTKPNTIIANQVMLEQTIVNTLATTRTEKNNDTLVTPKNKFLSPDFGTGIIIQIENLVFRENEVSFHKDQIIQPPKFDPSHISLRHIQINLSDIIMREDTLAAELKSLSAQLPGFDLSNVSTSLNMNRNQGWLSGLHLSSGMNEIKADLLASYDFKSAKETGHDRIEINMQSRMDPNDFAYFLNDSLMNLFGPWGPTELTAVANYYQGKGEIKKLNLKTGNSEVSASGVIRDLWDLKKIAWTDMKADAAIGADFKKVLTPFIGNLHLPPDITIHTKSHGQPDDITADAKIITTWGDVTATGHAARQLNNMDVTVNLTGETVDLGKWLDVSLLGPVDLTAEAKGMIGNNQHVEINGFINDIELLNQSIQHITFQSGIRKDSASIAIEIEDPDYRSEIHSEISFTGPLTFTNTIQLDSFKLGRLLHRDSTLSISGDTKSEITMDSATLEGLFTGKQMLFHKQSMEYSLDTLYVHALLSPSKSDLSYYSNYGKTNLLSNFDIRDASEVIQSWSENISKGTNKNTPPAGDRTANLNIDLENPGILKLLGIEVDDFSSLRVTGEFDEQKQTAMLNATSGNFKGYGISFDTLHTNLMALHDTLSSRMNVKNLLYNDIQLGNLEADIVTRKDTAVSNLLLAKDTLTLLGLSTRIIRSDSGVFVYPDTLLVFNHTYFIDRKNPVFINNHNVSFNHFQVSRDDMQMNLDGDLNYFDVSVRNIDLTPLNYLLSPDTTLINKGHLTGQVSYSRDRHFNLHANVDSLRIFNSTPVTITATSTGEGNRVPFDFQLTNPSNKIDLQGLYFPDNKEVDASLLLDLNNLELFSFLVSNVVEEMKGTLKGETTIHGPLQKPALKGYLQFVDVSLTTVNPKLSFNIEDDRITLDQSSLSFNNFTLYDREHHPLKVDGSIFSKDYESFGYDLHINSDRYSLINNPDSTSGKLRGMLVIDSDIKLKGNEKDTDINAKLTIKNATELTVVNSKGDIELLKAEGIIDFVDPSLLLDTISLEPSGNFYDSLIASLPDFNLNSTVTIEDNAVFRVLIDEKSGDYIKASGGANLELGYDRTGNLSLNGNYTISKGVYRLSFYDLVKKNFVLVQGSSINWHGSPKNGDLNIKAILTVESNSIGLIGHEIGENEKSIYKRSLDYQVGINITGTIEAPIIAFSLDLPQKEKANYPVLANKLDRLRQPEYASELNKQVFGLLVLGGFLPESSADVNSSVIATTALANSVNSLLASQLNRFANQYVKGVNIDVGIQSFSDYSAPGGKTQTAMDFRVSKTVFNERLSFEIGGDFDINQDQSGGNTGKNYRGDIAIIYDLTGNGDKKLKLFNNETYDIVYQEIRNTGISLIFIREFENKKKHRNKKE